MTGGDCGTALPAQSDVILGTNPYSIDASELNISGYSYSICYSCDINPSGLTLITFTKDFIQVTALVLDCSYSLTDTYFANPPVIPYSSFGSNVILAYDYSVIFAHSLISDCVLSDCKLMEAGC